MVSYLMIEHLYGATFVPPEGEMGYARVLAPWRRPYRTADGRICMLAYTDRQWRRFWHAAGRPEMMNDPRFADLAARTRHIRLAPAVTVLPLHHPIRVAEQWATLDLLSNGRVDFAAGRGYDKREYLPFHVSFENNQSIFDEGLELVRKLWQADGRMSYHGKHYQFDDVRITPKPVQKPIPTYVGSFSKP